MQIKARFIGDDTVKDYRFGEIYHLVIRNDTIFNELRGSEQLDLEEFLTNWIPITPGA